MQNPLADTAPDTLPLLTNWVRFGNGDAKFVSGMGTTMVKGWKGHLHRDAFVVRPR